MRFKDESGTEFLIEFERQSKERPAHVQKGRRMGEAPRKAVQTTARLLKVTGPGPKDRETFREYTVGHHYKDKFNHETGRKVALTMALYDAPTKGGGEPLLGTRLTKEFRTKVWETYHNRRG